MLLNKYQFVIDGEQVETKVERNGSGWHVVSRGVAFEIEQRSDGLYIVSNEDMRLTVAAVRHEGVFYVDLGRVQLEFAEASQGTMGHGSTEQHREKDKVYAPMPGKVVKLLVSLGEMVSEKQPLVIVEAMKMENLVLSPSNGKVKAIHFAAGDQIDTERPIVELELES